MAIEIEIWANEAERAAGAGNWAQAEALWRKVVEKSPNHPKAHHRLGIHAYQRRALKEAANHLERAIALAPLDPFIRLMLANVERDIGNIRGELEVLDGALAVDAYFYPALLAKAIWQELHSTPSAAAETYRNVIKIAPPENQWPRELKDQMLHGRNFAQKVSQGTHDKLLAALGSDWQNNAKWREAVSIMAGLTKPYPSICNQLYVPRLPATTFFDVSCFEWVKEMEAQTDAILEELQAALVNRKDGFTPYIQYLPGQPVNQWAELNHSDRWTTLPLWLGGKKYEENIAACPKTFEALSNADLADIDGLCPNAIFSALAPHTEIPPHNGETNARLVAHLPLIVPDNCVFKCGFDERPWIKGEIFAFDDSIEHAAYNNSDELRVVLLFDIWNPLLSMEEREIVRILARTMREC
ncbi:MAG: hypothetical protein FD163_652 [Hyphomonadaceae bacterium]|nr:MAG: hypothetical protein FD163_652 [Hyphomonadaceae bacterium]